jgi:SAM-dependent methyltransferase
MPVWLGRKHDVDDASIYRPRSAGNPEKARFVLEMLFRGLKRLLKRAAPKARASHWSAYMQSTNYTAEHFEAKSRFVDEAVAEFAPRRVLDVGCNTGHFSVLAARRGTEVVAIDYDPAVVGEVWRTARAERLNVLPLVVNLTRPTPAMGWRNRECPSFLERSRGAFDCVFLLAVIHHMLVTERIPLAEIVDQAAELTTDLAIIEFVGPEDSMFRRLTRGREALHADLTPALFESVCARRFEVVRSQHIDGSARWTYLLRKK